MSRANIRCYASRRGGRDDEMEREMAYPPDFWRALDALVAGSEIVIDRPRGSAHPRYPDVIYPLDYGYLAGTRAADGDGIDVRLFFPELLPYRNNDCADGKGEAVLEGHHPREAEAHGRRKVGGDLWKKFSA